MDTQIIRCVECSSKMRIPRNLGLLKATCPTCGYGFLFNSYLGKTYKQRRSYAPGPEGFGTIAPTPGSYAYDPAEPEKGVPTPGPDPYGPAGPEKDAPTPGFDPYNDPAGLGTSDKPSDSDPYNPVGLGTDDQPSGSDPYDLSGPGTDDRSSGSDPYDLSGPGTDDRPSGSDPYGLSGPGTDDRPAGPDASGPAGPVTVTQTADPETRGPAGPGTAAPNPVRPRKKGGAGGWLALAAILLLVFIAAHALKNSNTGAGTPLPTPRPLPTSSAVRPTSPVLPTHSPLPSPQVTAQPVPTDSPAPSPSTNVSPATQLTAYERASELIPYFDLRYFLTQLDDTELDVVCTIYECAMNFEERCTFDEVRVGEDKFEQLFRLMNYECPELFQLDYTSGYRFWTDAATKEVTSCKLDYLITDQSRYEEMRSDCERVIDGFVAQTQGFSDYEKEKAVFDYIASNCWYNLDTTYCGTSYGALIEHEAKCDGFADAMKWSMEALGIQCLEVAGIQEGADSGHAWNIVGLDGSYYLVDTTASVHYEWRANGGIDELNATYGTLNVTDEMDSEYPLRDTFFGLAPVPSCDSMNASYYARTGKFVPAGADPTAILLREMEAMLASGGSIALMQFESTEEFEAFYNGASGQIISDWLSGCGKQWSSSSRWNLDLNVLLVKVRW